MDLTSVFEHLPLPALLVAPDRTLLGFNRLMLEYHRETDREEQLRATMGHDWTGLSPTVVLAEQGKAFHDEVFSTEGVTITEWQMPGDSTTPVHGRYRGHRIVDSDAVTGAVLIREDVSKAVGFERLARRSQAQFQLLAEQVRDIVLITDLDGMILSCNPAGLAALRYESYELIGQPTSILSFDPGGQPERWRKLVDRGGWRHEAAAVAPIGRHCGHCATRHDGPRGGGGAVRVCVVPRPVGGSEAGEPGKARIPR